MIKKGIIIFLAVLMPVTLTFHSCDKVIDVLDPVLQIIKIINNLKVGWLEDNEDMDNIPEDITPFDEDTRDLAGIVSLESKFPPIGDQGQYGTCVAWAVGYNLKTALNAIEKGWTQTQLASTANQVSPQDLWLIIPSSKRGSGCGGTNFEPALDAIIKDGVATLSEVPYTTKLDCSGNKGGNSSNKLANYRKIASETQGMDVDNFKGYLNAGRPIAIGAKLGDRFMRWDSDNIINNDTYNNPGMQHAYHAMALVGYDDSKRAFRVRNSWGTAWGDRGSIWVDYDFFCGTGSNKGKSFCFAAFVAQNPVSVSSMGTPTTSQGTDLLAFFADDYDYDGDDHYTRTAEYEVYNSGTTTIRPSQKWTVTYMYYNAKNANSYEIIFDDYYTDEFGGEEGDYDDYEDARGLVGGFWNNMTLSPGESVGSDFVINYVMPKITGSYYLVAMADAYDVIREVNEDNNFYFITADGGKPLEYVNGVITNPKSKSSIQKSSAEKRPAPFSNTEYQTTVVPGNLNSYTPDEIKAMLIHDKKTGRLDAKIKAFHAENSDGRKFEKRSKK